MNRTAKTKPPKSGRGSGARRGPGRRSGPSPAVRKAFRTAQHDHVTQLVLGRLNYLLMGAGLIAITIGFILLSLQEISISTILIVSGYCLLLPAGLLLRNLPGRGAEPTRGPGDVGE